MKFTLNNAFEFGWEGLKGFSYSSKEDFENASAAFFEVADAHGKIKTTRSDRVYFVAEGEGEFEIDGEVTPVAATDVVIVPKNTPYDYRRTGDTFKLFLVHVPAFDPECEIQLE